MTMSENQEGKREGKREVFPHHFAGEHGATMSAWRYDRERVALYFRDKNTWTGVLANRSDLTAIIEGLTRIRDAMPERDAE